MKERGDFGQKVFDYIYLPAFAEKYALLNDVIRGVLTEEEAKSLQSKRVAITHGSIDYNLCLEAKDLQVVQGEVEHYYCYSIENQILDHVAVTGGNNL